MGASKKPGPLCQYTNSDEPDHGTSNRYRMPNPGATGLIPRPPATPATRVDTLIFDQEQVERLLQSVAYAKVLERHTKLVWKSYDESAVINAIYTILPFGKPGTVEVDSGDSGALATETEQQTEHLLEQFAIKLTEGASATVRFLGGQQQIRHSCLESVQGVYREASSMNHEIQDVAQRAIARLTMIKAASTLVLKSAALAGGGLPAFLIGTGYDVSLNLVTDWSQSSEAKLIGVETKVVDKVGKKVIKDAAKNLAYVYKGEESAPAHKARWLEKRLAAMEQQLESRANAERLSKYAKDSRRLARAQQAASSARFWSRALSSVKFVFFAWDVYNVGKDADRNFKSAGYENSWEGIKDSLH
jgi:hypothetical protein